MKIMLNVTKIRYKKNFYIFEINNGWSAGIRLEYGNEKVEISYGDKSEYVSNHTNYLKYLREYVRLEFEYDKKRNYLYEKYLR